MPYQTAANGNAFVMGSCRVSIPSSSGGYVHLGSARGVKISEAWEQMDVEVDNTPLVMIGAKKQTVTVEGNLLELNFQKLARMRGGLDTFSTTTFDFDSGGNMTVTPQALYLVHTAATSSQTIAVTIYYASVTDALTIPYPSDDKTDVAEIPFKIKGICMSTRTAGSQLMNIVDTRTGVYSTTYYSTSI
jgi:hypothetical protein